MQAEKSPGMKKKVVDGIQQISLSRLSQAIGTALLLSVADVSAALLELSDLNGENGFSLDGINPRDLSGSSVSSAGDINGDGFSDVIIGAPDADPNDEYSGQAYVIFGQAGPFPANMELSLLNGDNGFIMNGYDRADHVGESVSNAGDVNGDGIDDIVIGAPGLKDRGFNTGGAYIIFGKTTAFQSVIELTNIGAGNGFRVFGASGFDSAGDAVSNAGDFNDDGIDDIIIGSPRGFSSGGIPHALVVFGSTDTFPLEFDLADIDGDNGVVINGITNNISTGASVDSGDINGDGISDLIIGAPFANPDGRNNAGQSYVVFGRSGAFQASMELSDLDGSNGFMINGINIDDKSGSAVSNAGDINGDGIDDVIIGGDGYSPPSGPVGKSYVIFGQTQAFQPVLELSDLDGGNGFTMNGNENRDRFGETVGAAGDFNTDGIDDFIVTAQSADANIASEGQTYIIYGKTNGFCSSFDVSNLPDSEAYILNGVSIADFSGRSAHSVEDINGDGVNDVIIGAFQADSDDDFNIGRSYVVFGPDTISLAGFESLECN